MPIHHLAATMLGLCALSGAIHVIAPDHWIPASVVAWQRDWSPGARARLAATAVFAHVLTGFAAFALFVRLETVPGMTPRLLMGLAFLAVAMGLAWRITRFSRLRAVLLAGPESGQGFRQIFWLLGPCEYLLPILLKAKWMGTGYLLPTILFGLGSWLGLLGLVTLGQRLWNRPLWLPRSIYWGQQPYALLPVLACLAAGFGALLRLG